MQRRYAVQFGAFSLLQIAGKLPTIYPAITPKMHTIIHACVEKQFAQNNRDPYSPALKPLIFDLRERALQAEVLKLCKKAKKIIIIFGEGHNLESYFKQQNFQRIETLSPKDQKMAKVLRCLMKTSSQSALKTKLLIRLAHIWVSSHT